MIFVINFDEFWGFESKKLNFYPKLNLKKNILIKFSKFGIFLSKIPAQPLSPLKKPSIKRRIAKTAPAESKILHIYPKFIIIKSSVVVCVMHKSALASLSIIIINNISSLGTAISFSDIFHKIIFVRTKFKFSRVEAFRGCVCARVLNPSRCICDGMQKCGWGVQFERGGKCKNWPGSCNKFCAFVVQLRGGGVRDTRLFYHKKPSSFIQNATLHAINPHMHSLTLSPSLVRFHFTGNLQ